MQLQNFNILRRWQRQYPDNELDLQSIDRKADELIRKYHFGSQPPVWMHVLIEGEGFHLQDKTFEGESIASFDAKTKTFYAKDVSKPLGQLSLETVAWRNFALAHLLGRYVLSHTEHETFKRSLLLESTDDNDTKQANFFAAFLLLPLNALKRSPEYIDRGLKLWPEASACLYQVPIEVFDLRRKLLPNGEKHYIFSPNERADFVQTYNNNRSEYL